VMLPARRHTAMPRNGPKDLLYRQYDIVWSDSGPAIRYSALSRTSTDSNICLSRSPNTCAHSSPN